MTVETASLNDLSEIINLKLALYIETKDPSFVVASDYTCIYNMYEQFYKDGTAVHYIIRDQDRIVACAGGFLKDDNPYFFLATPYYGFIGDVYTLPEYRNRGCAKRLSEHVLNWLKDKNVETVRLLTTAPARPLYEALGFRPSDRMVLKQPVNIPQSRPDIPLEEATQTDLPELVQLVLKLYQEADYSRYLPDHPERIIEDTYRTLMRTGKGTHFIIRSGGAIVACSGAFIKNDIPYCFAIPPFYGYIDDVYTRTDHRKKGYARALVSRSLQWLKDRNVKEIRLSATPEGRPLYETMGFKSTPEMVLAFEKAPVTTGS